MTSKNLHGALVGYVSLLFTELFINSHVQGRRKANGKYETVNKKS